MDEQLELHETAGENDVAAFTTASAPSGRARKDRPKRTLITAACEECRARKAKCDGGRPRCSRCLRVKKTCTYSVNPGETRQAAAKLKTESLQKDYDSVFDVLDSLRSMPLSDARSLLDRLRASQDAASFLEQFKMTGKTVMLDSPATSSSQRSSVSTGRDQSSCEESSRSSEASSASPGVPLLLRPHQAELDQEATQTTLPDGLELPTEAALREGVRTFYRGSGQLFHVFGRQQIEAQLDQLFQNKPQFMSRRAICEICCVASVGVLYTPKPYDAENTMYLIARALLDDAVQENSLEAAKCCILLGMFNLMSKATVAMAYIELGMDLCRRHFAHANVLQQETSSLEDQRTEGKKVWRSLLFLGCWISSTIGYVSSNNWMLTDSPILGLEIHGDRDIANVVQNEMVKIAVLKHAIVRIPQQSSPKSLEAVRESINQWHQDLPPVMRLTNLLDTPDMSMEVRVAIYTVHLLYLGGSILFYRQILNKPPQSDDNGTDSLFDQALADAVTAAQQSSRILNLLQEAGGVNQRCWLSIYQSYCASMLILHGIAQSFLRSNMSAFSYAEGFDQVRRCLDILTFCAEIDGVAAKFVNLLEPHYKNLQHIAATSSMYQPGQDPRLQATCTELLDLVRRPFGHFEEQERLFSQATENLDSAPYGWQSVPRGKNINTLLSKLGPPQWLNGDSPHGWQDDVHTRSREKE